MTSKQLEFVPISSLINPSFWNKLSEIKLNDDKLDEKEHPVWGYFSNINNKCKFPILEVNSTSFNSHFDSQKIYIPFHGRILNVNTVEIFKDYDKTQCINRIGQDIFMCIENGEALETPSLLNQFYILSYADLKKFNFYYWFAFPVPYNLSVTYNSVKNIYDEFTKDQLEYIWNKYCDIDNTQKPYFLVSLENESVDVYLLKDQLQLINGSNFEIYYFVFYDLSLLENSPASTLRNYVTLILHYCPDLQGKAINFLSLRIKRNDEYKLTISDSVIFNCDLPIYESSVSDFINQDPDKRWVGWEKNERGKLGPRLSNMKSFLDPKELAESSVDLNLKLMKWRLLSNINLEKIKATKFLLLGAGTLGCSVARILLGWGAINISFIDNSVVSYSNPVRQSLFTFEDSQNSKPKAIAAAENLLKIFPGVKSKSYQMTIPMPGHPVGDSVMEQLKKDVDLLTNLISEHDVIFLLMDSRESRWLPTLLGAYFSKVVINAALGFDSYLVMRHGVRVDTEEFRVRQHDSGFKSLKGNFLGCYFCNDVTAPGNSTKDRTLDQQCTVTRPGVSAIAGALAAELAISILQHKEGPKAAAFYQLGNIVNTHQELDNQCVLGIIPHSIRGYLSSFSQVLPAVERYQQCTACSETVLDAYRKDGFNFLLQVFQNSKYLEDITGLSNMNQKAEDTTIWEFSDEEEVHCTDYEDETDSDGAQKASPEQPNNVVEGESDSVQLEGGVFEVFKQKISEKLSLQEIIEDVMENLLKHAEKVSDRDESVIEKKSEDSISSTEFFNRILPHDILKIVQKLQLPSESISSNSSQTEMEKFSESPNEKNDFQDNNSEKSVRADTYSGDHLSASFSKTTKLSKIFQSQDVMIMNENFLSSTSSILNSSGFPSGIVNKFGIPKELLPVLEKQGSRRNLYFSSRTNSMFDKNTTEQKITEIMKPKTVEYSLSNVNAKNKHENSSVKFSPSESYSNSEQLGDAPMQNTDTLKSNRNSVVSLLTLKSMIKNFASSASSQNMSVNSATAKSKSSISGKIKSFFVAKNIRTSSDSLSDGVFNEETTKNDDIITLAKPQQIFSSGSLTSDNLGLDDSVYYLAETDSDKTVVIN